MTPPRPAVVVIAPQVRALASQLTPATPIRLALGLVYLEFGLLKLFPDLSPAELLAEQTLLQMGFGVSANAALWGLGLFECLIGIAFLSWAAPKLTVAVFYAHMAGTMLSLVLLPELTFTFAPFAPNLEGQYILKNLVFLACGPALLGRYDARVSP